MGYSGISKEELEVLIRKKEQELYKLKAAQEAPKEEITYNAGNGQVGYYRIGAREGIDKEIRAVREELAELHNQLNIVNRIKLEKEVNKINREFEEKKELDAQMKEREEENRFEEIKHKMTFQQVKNIYKNNTSFLERAILSITGKGLKKPIAYSTEELEYLVATYKGDTVLQQVIKEHIDKKYQNFQEQQNKFKESNITNFKKIVGNNNLSEKIELEEMNQGRRMR